MPRCSLQVDWEDAGKDKRADTVFFTLFSRPSTEISQWLLLTPAQKKSTSLKPKTSLIIYKWTNHSCKSTDLKWSAWRHRALVGRETHRQVPEIAPHPAQQPRHCPIHPSVALSRVKAVIQPSPPMSPPSPFAFDLSQCQGNFQWVSISHPEAQILELRLQHPSFQWLFRVDFLQDWLVWSPCSPTRK